MYDNRLLFTVRVPEPGTRAASPSETLVEPKVGAVGGLRGRTRRLARWAVRHTDRAVGGPVRGSRYNSWWLQLVASVLLLVLGVELMVFGWALATGLLGW